MIYRSSDKVSMKKAKRREEEEESGRAAGFK